MEEPAIQDKISELEAKLDKLPSESADEATQKELYLELGDAYLDANESAKAKQLYQKLLTETNEAYYAAACYELGKIALDENDFAAAQQNLQLAIEWGQKTNDENTQAKAHHAYAFIMLQTEGSTTEESKACLDHIMTAVTLFSKNKKYDNLGKAFMLLTGFTQARLTTNKAIAYFKQLLAQHEEATDILGFTHYHLAAYYEADENSKEAFRHFEQALHYKNKLNIGSELGETYYHLGLLHDEQGNSDKAFEYNVIALRHMLSLDDISTYASMAVIFVQGGIEDCTNATLQQEARTLLEQAQKLDLLPHTDAEGATEDSDGFVYDHSYTGNLLEQTREEQEQTKISELEELKNDFAKKKAALPDSAEDFAQAAYDLLSKLDEGIDRSLFSFLARKKNKTRRAELNDILKESQEALKQAMDSADDDLKSILETWKGKLDDNFRE
ncbi:hypothetical protein [uncultured Microscilla sp.]|uniref:tetratricopeptide repeat protein n=1 Tax=uncultured Microscilla sp. TaxID=432653 RepID=UPI00260A62CE|nr:hypothetical protein [uncultured Microscilla sp.]